jgi:uncharacterized protein (TIGR03435 family)
MTRSLGNPDGPPDDEFSRSPWMKETNTTMAEFTKALQYVLERPVVDHTGLTGRWDFRVQWTPDESQFGVWFLRPLVIPMQHRGCLRRFKNRLG